MPKPVIIDCDPGHDDAMALMLAVASPELELVAVTTVAGNQTLDRVTANAIRVLDVVDAQHIPVAAGADRGLIHTADSASDVHGETGLDGPDLPPPSREPEPIHAVELMARKLREQRLTLIPIGPLTNIALLLATHPELHGPDRADRDHGRGDRHRQRHPQRRVQRLGRPGRRLPRLHQRPGHHDGRPRRHPPRDAQRRTRRRAAGERAAPAPSSPICTASTASSISASTATATRPCTTRSRSPT